MELSNRFLDVCGQTQSEEVPADGEASEQERRQLDVLVREAGDDLDGFRDRVAGWFDDQMATLTRRYRTRARCFTVAFGLAVAVACNVDAVGAARAGRIRDAKTALALLLAAGRPPLS